MTLAGDYTNSIHTDAVNRAIQRNLAMQVASLVLQNFGLGACMLRKTSKKTHDLHSG